MCTNVDALADLLREKCPLQPDGFSLAPDVETEAAFWTEVRARSGSRYAPEKLHARVSSELESVDVSRLTPSLFLGNMSANSPLVQKLLGIGSTIVIVTDPADAHQPTNGDCLIVAPPYSQLRGLSSSDKPTLVCSASDASGVAAAVCAALIAKEENLGPRTALERVEAKRGLCLLADDEFELIEQLESSSAAFEADDFALTVSLPEKPRPPPPLQLRTPELAPTIPAAADFASPGKRLGPPLLKLGSKRASFGSARWDDAETEPEAADANGYEPEDEELEVEPYSPKSAWRVVRS